ncbi:hypothetical protein P3G55_10735 [Leptospira sp. 96542]|nr:hypothetical protein [Leptospira sp. 96542]
MKFVVYLLLTLFLGTFGYCTSSPKVEVNEKIDYLTIVTDLQSRGYYVKVSNYKGIDSYVTAYPNTKMIDGDLQRICTLPNLRNLMIDNSKIPETFFDQLDQCNLSQMKLLSLKDVTLKNGVFCLLSEKNQFHDNLGFVNTNINDEGLNCLKRFEFLEELSFQGPVKKFSDESFCQFVQSNIRIKDLRLKNLDLSPKAYNCLLYLKGVEHFGFKKIEGRSANDMKKLEDLYFKKNGRKVIVDVFEYDRP